MFDNYTGLWKDMTFFPNVYVSLLKGNEPPDDS